MVWVSELNWYFGQIRRADFGILIPSIHGVDRFRKFGTAGLVDTTGVDPNILEPLVYNSESFFHT